jgi:hypothetical protein
MSSNSRTGEAAVSADQEIFGAISLGLHQTTQPLTILQGTLELALLNANTVEQYRSAIERSLGELRRVADCFEHLRSVAQLQQGVSDAATLSVPTMTKAVLMSLKERSAAVGVQLVLQSGVEGRKEAGRVTMSASRISASLKMILSDLLTRLESGSKVVVQIEDGATDLLIRVNALCGDQNASEVAGPERPPTPRQKLALALATSAGAELTLGPFYQGVLFRLPKAPPTLLGEEIKLQNDEVAHV